MTPLSPARASVRVALGRAAVWLIPCLLFIWAVGLSPNGPGRDLMPYPDATEYGLLADQMAHFRPPLLPIGAGLYPSRYPLTFPLLLVPAVWLTGGDLAQLHWAAAFFGLIAVFLMARVGAWLTGSRLAGGLAATLWGLEFTTVGAALPTMSETALVMVLFASLALARPWIGRHRNRLQSGALGLARAAALGLALGWLTLTKVPFVWWAFGLTALVFLDALERHRFGPLVALISAGLACFLADRLYRNWAFGSWSGDGYVFWAPNVYSDLSITFNLHYILTPWSAASPDGNLSYYADRILGGRGTPPCLLLAAIGLFWPRRRGRPGKAVLALFAGWVLVGVAFCLLYFFQTERFLVLWLPAFDLAIAWALVHLPFWAPLRRRRLGRWRLSTWARGAGALIALALVSSRIHRVQNLIHAPQAPYRDLPHFYDQIRPMLSRVPADALLISNFQLPLVDRWRPAPGPTVMLNTWFLDFYLLSSHIWPIATIDLQPHSPNMPERRALAPLPEAWRDGPTVLIGPDDTWIVSPAEFDTLTSRPSYLLVVAPRVFPESGRHFASVIRPMLERRTRLEPIQRAPDVTLYRLVPRASTAPALPSQ